MASEAFQRLVERVVTDPEFAARLEREHEAVLNEYDLSEDERAALVSGDPTKVRALGLDERVTKYSCVIGPR